MTREYSRMISNWKYGGEYSFYDHSDQNIESFMDSTHYTCTDEDGDLVGYFCFGEDARIPTVEQNAYDGGFLDIGLGLRPDLCGQGYGLSFLENGLDFAQRTFNTKQFRLSVAAFNARAIKVYTRAGFVVEKEVTNSYFKNKFFIMKNFRK